MQEQKRRKTKKAKANTVAVSSIEIPDITAAVKKLTKAVRRTRPCPCTGCPDVTHPSPTCCGHLRGQR